MDKNKLKYLTDVALFIDMCSISAIGILLGFIIPKGEGHGHELNKYFLGLHRHEWGDIHLYLSLFLLLLLVFHIWLNWTWVINLSKRYFGKNWANALWAFTGSWFIVLLIGWAVVQLL